MITLAETATYILSSVELEVKGVVVVSGGVDASQREYRDFGLSQSIMCTSRVGPFAVMWGVATFEERQIHWKKFLKDSLSMYHPKEIN